MRGEGGIRKQEGDGGLLTIPVTHTTAAKLRREGKCLHFGRSALARKQREAAAKIPNGVPTTGQHPIPLPPPSLLHVPTLDVPPPSHRPRKLKPLSSHTLVTSFTSLNVTGPRHGMHIPPYAVVESICRYPHSTLWQTSLYGFSQI
jgi:hypothetical protein